MQAPKVGRSRQFALIITIATICKGDQHNTSLSPFLRLLTTPRSKDRAHDLRRGEGSDPTEDEAPAQFKEFDHAILSRRASH